MQKPYGHDPMYIQKAFDESGDYSLFWEFLETLINDPVVPEKLRRRVWALVSTPFEKQEPCCAEVCAAFQDSEDEENLVVLWQAVVAQYWPAMPDCPLKRELA